jgi:hypothetical protein
LTRLPPVSRCTFTCHRNQQTTVNLPGRLVAVVGALAARRRRVVADAGVVDETMQPPEAPSDLVDERADLREGGEIGDHDLATADALDRRRGPLLAAPVHHHMRAPLKQPPGELLPDPSCRARHQHGVIHASPSPAIFSLQAAPVAA